MLTEKADHDDGVRVAVRVSADVRGFRSVGAGGAIVRVWPHLVLLAALAWPALTLRRWAVETTAGEDRTTIQCDRTECIVSHRSSVSHYEIKGLWAADCGDLIPETRYGDVMPLFTAAPQRQVIRVRNAKTERLLYVSPEPGPMPAELMDVCSKINGLIHYETAYPKDGFRSPDAFRAELPGPVVPGTAARGLARGTAAIGLLAFGIVAFAIARLRQIRVTRFVIDRMGARLLAYEGRWIGRKRKFVISRDDLGEITLVASPYTKPEQVCVTVAGPGARPPLEPLLMREDEAQDFAAWLASFRDHPRLHYRS